MAFKFERLEIWTLALDYVDKVYDGSLHFPDDEKFNLTSQFRRAATSIGLNIAEGSTGQTDKEQVRFLGIALRSLLETVACLHIAKRRDYLSKEIAREIYRDAERLSAKIQAMRSSLSPSKSWVREGLEQYEAEEGNRTDDPALADR